MTLPLFGSQAAGEQNSSAAAERARIERTAVPREYLMCSPDYFDVTYAINAWPTPWPRAEASTARDAM